MREALVCVAMAVLLFIVTLFQPVMLFSSLSNGLQLVELAMTQALPLSPCMSYM